MRSYLLLLFIVATFNCTAQDTTKYLSRSSVSFTAATNIVYANVHQIISEGNTTFYRSSGGAAWDYNITPVTSVNPFFTLEYNYLLHQCTHFFFVLHGGVSYLQYTYKMDVTGTYNNIPVNDGGTFQAQTWANVFELNMGISVNYRITNKVSWHNEIDLMEGIFSGSSPTFTTNGPDNQSPFFIIVGYIYSNSFYTYSFYQTGFNIKVSENISVMPEIAIPLFDIGIFSKNQGSAVTLPTFPSPQIGAPSPIYRSLRTGITLTYNFNRK